jgi:RNA polymerase sigma factor (sigma-70 family)
MAAYSTYTDPELVALLKQGDQTAFEQLYRNYSVRILKRLVRLLKDEETAKEILQDVYLKIWEKREGLDPEQSFRSFLFRMAENMVMDFFRKAAVSTELYYDDESVNVGTTYNDVLHAAKTSDHFPTPSAISRIFPVHQLQEMHP